MTVEIVTAVRTGDGLCCCPPPGSGSGSGSGSGDIDLSGSGDQGSGDSGTFDSGSGSVPVVPNPCCPIGQDLPDRLYATIRLVFAATGCRPLITSAGWYNGPTCAYTWDPSVQPPAGASYPRFDFELNKNPSTGTWDYVGRLGGCTQDVTLRLRCTVGTTGPIFHFGAVSGPTADQAHCAICSPPELSFRRVQLPFSCCSDPEAIFEVRISGRADRQILCCPSRFLRISPNCDTFGNFIVPEEMILEASGFTSGCRSGSICARPEHETCTSTNPCPCSVFNGTHILRKDPFEWSWYKELSPRVCAELHFQETGDHQNWVLIFYTQPADPTIGIVTCAASYRSTTLRPNCTGPNIYRAHEALICPTAFACYHPICCETFPSTVSITWGAVRQDCRSVPTGFGVLSQDPGLIETPCSPTPVPERLYATDQSTQGITTLNWSITENKWTDGVDLAFYCDNTSAFRLNSVNEGEATVVSVDISPLLNIEFSLSGRKIIVTE